MRLFVGSETVPSGLTFNGAFNAMRVNAEQSALEWPPARQILPSATYIERTPKLVPANPNSRR